MTRYRYVLAIPLLTFPLSLWISLHFDLEFSHLILSMFWASILCFVPYLFWIRYKITHPIIAVQIQLFGIFLRFMGMIVVCVPIWMKLTRNGSLFTYAVFIGTFLFFELVTVVLYENLTRVASPRERQTNSEVDDNVNKKEDE